MPKLTPKQAAFVREYAKDFNASAAANRAGLTPDYGRQLLTKSHVQAEIERLGSEARTNAVLTLSELQEWWSNLVRAHQPGGDAREALRASEYLAKSLGGFTEKTEHTGGMRIEVVYVDDHDPH